MVVAEDEQEEQDAVAFLESSYLESGLVERLEAYLEQIGQAEGFATAFPLEKQAVPWVLGVASLLHPEETELWEQDILAFLEEEEPSS